ncbi:hypothetical protein [Gilvibacter sp.]|uniref:hypothetical protein n=1 Tax=Gilvibacter sp. TaxID=2729997 RepID=UPI0025C4F711|nr:hypothetical protein [Gilvibacter sp.]NQX77170.1 hypothetical protein [Gilvibacter sp.]
MKNTFKTLLLICFLIPLSACAQNNVQTQELIGTWKLDMSPQDTTDDNFAMMRIEKIKGNSFEGTFYREGVKLTNGQLNTQLGIVYGALVSGDNSGSYNTTFYLKEGKLYGTTHAIDRNFLAVWIATKTEN